MVLLEDLNSWVPAHGDTFRIGLVVGAVVQNDDRVSLLSIEGGIGEIVELPSN